MISEAPVLWRLSIIEQFRSNMFKEELDMYLAHQAEGTKIRAKIEHIEQNEHPSQFF